MSDNNNIFSEPVSNGQSVVDRIVDRITQAIINGDLRPGDKIPTELELMQSLQVGRNSVREAVKVLVSFGVVEIRRAEGTFVCSSFKQRMLDPMLYGLILQQDNPRSLLELRQIFDTGVLKLAIDKADCEDIRLLQGAMLLLEAEVNSGDAARVLDADIGFHKVLAESVRNKLVLSISGYIDRMTIPSRLRTQNQILENGDPERYIELHREIVSVVENKDASAIGKAVEDHYTYWRIEV